ncbi:MAG TPA: carbamoyltransferase [Nitrospirales bacterium]|nr:carbamoyltransferase [Nitrospirales bacterium]
MKSGTTILGISAFYHDSAAALLREGRIVAAAQEERFTRVKGEARFPARAIAYCLHEGRLRLDELDVVVFYEKPVLKFERLLETYLAFAPEGYESFRAAMPLWADQKLRLAQDIRSLLSGDFAGELLFGNHHESHAASAFFPSPFQEAGIMVLDAVGEWSTSSLGVGRDNRLALSHEQRFPHSLGMLYSAFTYYTGFKVNSGEYKLMGLAPYGEPKYATLILDEIADLKDDGSLRLDLSYFNYCQGLTMTSERFHRLFKGPPRRPEDWITQKDMDLAASIQLICEEAVLRSARHLHRLTGMKNLVMAGGVALNCVANGRLSREGPFRNIWVQPAAGDAGGALGAALLAWHHTLNRPRTAEPSDSQRGSLLGPSFDDEEIGVFLDSVGARYRHFHDEAALLDEVGRLLAEGKIVGWFHGRMEYGPRALGARSILGDPRSPTMQHDMNVKIKFRESFRPFAPCILAEHLRDIVDTASSVESPYMLFVSHLREALRSPLDETASERLADPDLRVRLAVERSSLPAITHVDYSARVQTVDRERHGRFYRLLDRFHELTGCPVLVNTSFNIRGEPIVCTPEDAYHCFMGTHMDCLVLENHVLMKPQQPSEAVAEEDAYKLEYALD